MAYTFLDLAIEIIKDENKPLSVKEIWNKAVEKGLTKKLSSIGETPEKTLAARIYVDLKQKGENSKFIQISKRPALFCLKSLGFIKSDNKNNISEKNKSKITNNYHERDLHKLLSSYIYSDAHFKSYTKTIFHERSNHKIKGENHWLHPDIVGVRYPFEDFNDRTRELMSAMSFNTCKLFSFELKKEITFSNLRECYFQAVSNSSWANEGYLVSVNYEDSIELLDEMRRLNSAFGIGFILLDIKDYTQSEIILSAKANDDLDWNTIDRLCEDNKDFDKFIHTISSDLSGGELRNIGDFDEIFKSEDEFYKYLKDKHFIQ